MENPSAVEVEVLRSQVATLEQLLELQEAQARDHIELSRARLTALEIQASALKNANEALESLASSLREIYRAVPGVLIVFDKNGIITSANEVASSLLEYAPADLVGRSISTLFADESSPEVAEVEALARTGAVLRTEKTCVTKSGARIPVLLSATVLQSEASPSSSGIVSIAVDIRERKRLELELRQSQKLESVGRLAAGVAHEINTPTQFVGDNVHFLRDAMTELLGVLESYRSANQSILNGTPSLPLAAAAAETEDRAELAHLLESIPRALDQSVDGLSRIAAIVRSLKTFAHPDHAEMTGIDLNEAIRSTLVIASTEYKHVADLEASFGDLPVVMCHAGEVNQAILNIVVNAAHAIADAGACPDKKGRISVRTWLEVNHAVVAITDTGRGIPETIRNLIFDPFFTTKEVGRGTGQGLAIARSAIVDRHRGTLTYETECERGTTFYLRIPVNAPRRA